MSDNKAAVVPMGLTPRQANIALMAWKAVDGDIKVCFSAPKPSHDGPWSTHPNLLRRLTVTAWPSSQVTIPWLPPAVSITKPSYRS